MIFCWSRAFGTGYVPLLGGEVFTLSLVKQDVVGDGHHRAVQVLVTAGVGCARRWSRLWGMGRRVSAQVSTALGHQAGGA